MEIKNIKYFLAHTYRSHLTDERAKEYFKENEENITLHNSFKEAHKHLYRNKYKGLYDDCDYGIVRKENNEFKVLKNND